MTHTRHRVSDEQPKAEDPQVLSPQGASAVGNAETPNPPPDDYISRAEVLRICRELGSQSADLALYGAPENARSREAMEAAATRIGCAIALMPALPSAAPDVAGIVERLEKRLSVRDKCLTVDGELAGEIREAATALQSLSQSLASKDAEIERLTKERDQMEANWLAAKRRSYDAHLAKEAAEARIAELEKALEPFVFGEPAIESVLFDGMDDNRTGTFTIKLGALRRARLARQGAKT